MQCCARTSRMSAETAPHVRPGGTAARPRAPSGRRRTSTLSRVAWHPRRPGARCVPARCPVPDGTRCARRFESPGSARAEAKDRRAWLTRTAPIGLTRSLARLRRLVRPPSATSLLGQPQPQSVAISRPLVAPNSVGRCCAIPLPRPAPARGPRSVNNHTPSRARHAERSSLRDTRTRGQAHPTQPADPQPRTRVHLVTNNFFLTLLVVPSRGRIEHLRQP